MLKWLLIATLVSQPDQLYTVGVYKDQLICENAATRLTGRHEGHMTYKCEPWFDLAG